jgi:molybdopterin synthase sulfur carrier subunit
MEEEPMSVSISIPPTLRRLCGGADTVRVRPGTVAGAMQELRERFNGVHERLCNERGEIRGSVLVFVNDEDIRFLRNQDTELRAGDEVSIIPAFAGG